MPTLKSLPPEAAIRFFRAKGYKPTFDYREMEREEHAYSFTVAKAMNRDVLQDIRGAFDDHLANGGTLQSFQQQLRPTLQAKGWWGVQTMVDPATGEEREVQLGSSRRLKTIFDTNMRTAYAAGKWEQVQRTKATMPYLRYVAVMDGKERPEHRAWHNTVLPVDHPFWDEHYPPNGWGCRCSVQQLSLEDVKRLGLTVSENPPTGMPRTHINRRTGEVVKVPQGITPTFSYNVGKARMRALTPPPLDEPLAVPYSGPVSKVPMPKSRSVPSSMINTAEGEADEAVAQRFLSEFGAGLGKPKVFNDKTGEPLVISDDLFKAADGSWKANKNNRAKYLPLLAATLKDPDEIWHVWEELRDGRKVLRRRYLSRFAVDGQQRAALVAFETGKDGWSGVTTFQSRDEKYGDKQRRGSLLYRRTEEK